ncbi:hypothetical protein SShM2_178 [Synechococcus phage S-ShM2]|uniref:Gp181 n=3 Tax=Ahtivirus sagseatwo TaxID=2734079 RepID=A0A1D7SM97_9CAUD|nr:hypothetical protein SShM2_178 [Synechococcus phage S-ShM2]AGH57386.1 hypothetical protein CPLG_00132 [Cyanophage S-SSM2]AOO13282.1 hypothetical protein LIS021110_168 [Cyanophage S-RIM14]ADO97789.1 hypothetical protein SShM2_178 [Synechococcus phage S-ShM2]AOO13498.1 hypothetical protein LIS110610_168 [Cyanophage S-RIM14]AOO13714.1 hypothetical protein Np111211_168 [Cyanophage S-RIM14]
MKTLLIHVIAFWQVVVMNCIAPVNWKHCYRVDQWLLPDIVQGYKLWTGEETPYQEEQKYINNLNNTTE